MKWCSEILSTFVDAGHAERHDERSAANDVSWRAASLGEDSGEDGGCGTNTWLHIALDCIVGKVHRPYWQHFRHEWVNKLSYVKAL